MKDDLEFKQLKERVSKTDKGIDETCRILSATVMKIVNLPSSLPFYDRIDFYLKYLLEIKNETSLTAFLSDKEQSDKIKQAVEVFNEFCQDLTTVWKIIHGKSANQSPSVQSIQAMQAYVFEIANEFEESIVRTLAKKYAAARATDEADMAQGKNLDISQWATTKFLHNKT